MPPALAIHGRNDHLNRIEGRAGTHWDESVYSAVNRWAQHWRCVRHAEDIIHDGVRETRYELADGSCPVRLIVIDEAQHSWPGTTDRRHIALFGDPGTFSASLAYWCFVQEIEALNAPDYIADVITRENG